LTNVPIIGYLRRMTKRAHDITSDPDYAGVGPAIEKARVKAGFSKRKLATMLGYPPQVMATIINNQRRLDVIELCRIAAATGVSPMDLFRDATAPVAGRAAARPEARLHNHQDAEELLATA
jgi:transcriptional regulator with XRE-family HTH domain